jgi:nucleoside-diphosphate-sugar epimerase
MHVFVLGGTGFLGPPVVRRLVAAGHRVTVFHRGTTPADLPASVRVVLGERSGLPALRPALGRLAPDLVLDTHAYTEREARTAAEAFAGIARRAVVLSSGDVYRAYERLRGTRPGPPDPGPLTEDAPLRASRYPYRSTAEPGTRLYDYDKILVEEAYRAEPSLSATVLRLPMIYGPGDPQHRLFPYLKRMDDGRPALLLEEGQDRWRASRGYVEDIAAAIACAIGDDRAAGRTYNVGAADAPSEAAWIARIGRVAAWRGRVLPIPAERLPEALRTGRDWRHDLALDTARIREDLGIRAPVPADEAMARTVAWERAHPPEPAPPFDYAAEDAASRAHP